MLVHDTTITDDMKITGAQWRLFYKTLWPKDWYIDDIGVDFEDDRGNYILADDAIHALGDFGYVGYQGKDKTYESGSLFPVRMLYEAVMMPQMTRADILSFKVPKEKVEAFKALAASLDLTPF